MHHFFDMFLWLTVHLLHGVPLQRGLEALLQCLKEAHLLIVLLQGAVVGVDLLMHPPAVPHVIRMIR